MSTIDGVYYHGRPCKRGHGTLRYKSNGMCPECQQFHKSKYQAKLTPEEITRQGRATPQVNLAKVRRYKAAKANRVPKWADLEKIQAIYANCPPDKVVDHIIPLRGKLVSGLHVHNNLQYLTPAENAAKGNKFEIV